MDVTEDQVKKQKQAFDGIGSLFKMVKKKIGFAKVGFGALVVAAALCGGIG